MKFLSNILIVSGCLVLIIVVSKMFGGFPQYLNSDASLFNTMLIGIDLCLLGYVKQEEQKKHTVSYLKIRHKKNISSLYISIIVVFILIVILSFR